MERDHDEKHGRDDSVLERQTAYSLDRLAVAVGEWNRLIETRPSRAIEQLLADLEGAADYTSITMEAVRKLRLWRASAHWLDTELDSAAGSFHLAERQLSQRVDAALGRWEQRFEVGDPAITGRSGAAPGWPRAGPGRLRGLLRRGPPPAPLATAHEDAPAGRPELTGVPPAALPPPSSWPAAQEADIAARVFGPLELSVAGVRVSRWSSLKARAVFQYLLIHQDRPVRREVLMELEWPDHSHNSARNNLNVALCSLRSTLDWSGPEVQAVLHKEGCYLLNPAVKFWTDRSEFLSMTRDARQARQAGRTQRAIDACRSAVQLYRGPLFEDDPEGEWYLPERRHLKDLYLQALEYLAEAYCDSGQLLLAVDFGQQAISADPCYEAAHRLLMRCYARQNQQQLVSRQYRHCAAALHDELDVSPTTETVQLFRSLTSTV